MKPLRILLIALFALTVYAACDEGGSRSRGHTYLREPYAVAVGKNPRGPDLKGEWDGFAYVAEKYGGTVYVLNTTRRRWADADTLGGNAITPIEMTQGHNRYRGDDKINYPLRTAWLEVDSFGRYLLLAAYRERGPTYFGPGYTDATTAEVLLFSVDTSQFAFPWAITAQSLEYQSNLDDPLIRRGYTRDVSEPVDTMMLRLDDGLQLAGAAGGAPGRFYIAQSPPAGGGDPVSGGGVLSVLDIGADGMDLRTITDLPANPARISYESVGGRPVLILSYFNKNGLEVRDVDTGAVLWEVPLDYIPKDFGTFDQGDKAVVAGSQRFEVIQFAAAVSEPGYLYRGYLQADIPNVVKVGAGFDLEKNLPMPTAAMLNINGELSLYNLVDNCFIDADVNEPLLLDLVFHNTGFEPSVAVLTNFAPSSCLGVVQSEYWLVEYEGVLPGFLHPGELIGNMLTDATADFIESDVQEGDAVVMERVRDGEGAAEYLGEAEVLQVRDANTLMLDPDALKDMPNEVTYSVRAGESWTIWGSLSWYVGRAKTGEPHQNTRFGFTITSDEFPVTRGDYFTFRTFDGITRLRLGVGTDHTALSVGKRHMFVASPRGGTLYEVDLVYNRIIGRWR